MSEMNYVVNRLSGTLTIF